MSGPSRLWLLALTLPLLLAAGVDRLSSKDAASGLRAALGQGIDNAVASLGVSDGFLKNAKVAIPLPPALQKMEPGLRLIGRGEDAGTQYFQRTTAGTLATRFKPIVARATARLRIAATRWVRPAR